MTQETVKLGSPEAKDVADDIANKYKTVVYVYWRALEDNFLRLATALDQHALYGLRDDWAHTPIINTFYGIEVNTSLINYLDSCHGLAASQQELKKKITDDDFDEWYKNSISEFPITNRVLNKIRQKFHHTEAPTVIFRNKHTISQVVEHARDVGFDRNELLNLGGWNKEENSYLESLEFFDLRSSII